MREDNLTRRRFLQLVGAAGTVSLLSYSLPAHQNYAVDSSPVHVRLALTKMDPKGKEIKWLEAGVQEMKDRSKKEKYDPSRNNNEIKVTMVPRGLVDREGKEVITPLSTPVIGNIRISVK